jgi:tRNA C32,U32 (ribose-2'-O)-methylase TrmJ
LGRVTANDVNTSCHQPAVMPPMADDDISHMFRHIGETYDNCQVFRTRHSKRLGEH